MSSTQHSTQGQSGLPSKGIPVRLLAGEFWDSPLARFAQATGLVVALYDKYSVRCSGPHTPSPLAKCLAKAGFFEGDGAGVQLELDLVEQVLATEAVTCTVVLGALGLCAMPALVGGEVVGVFVVGWVPEQFIDPVISKRIAMTAGIHEMDVWQVIRMQPPMTAQKMQLYMGMLQNFVEVVLKQLEDQEHDHEEARTLRILADAATQLAGAHTEQGIARSLVTAIKRLIPGASIAVAMGDAVDKQVVVDHAAPLTFDPEIVSERYLKVPIKSAVGLLGVLDIRLPLTASKSDFSPELATLAAQAAVALQNAKLMADLALERNALNQANGELRNLHRMKDEFLATVSHELRTPLNAMLGWAQLLKEGQLSAEEFGDATIAIERNATIQARLIEDLLDVSRIISGKMLVDRSIISIVNVLQESIGTIRPSAESKGQILSVDLSRCLPNVRGDATRLQQVFWNILANATKFTPRGGAIRITGVSKAGFTTITIADNGKGIPRAFLPHLFDRFSQADGSQSRAFGGLGLGLAIVRHIIELHGGTVTAVSDGEGRGASFIVSLPIDLNEAELSRKLAAPPNLDWGDDDTRRQLYGFRILAVDDEPDSLRLVKFILEKGGASVRAVDSAASAYAEVRAWHPHLIVSDLSMPSEDGYQLIQKIRALPQAEGGATPAFALTAHAGAETKEKALNAGFQRHFTKPLDTQALLLSIKEFSELFAHRPTH